MLRKLSAVACLVLTLLAACVPPTPPAQESTPSTPVANQDVQFNSASNGYYQGTAKKQLVVIQSGTELTAALADITLLGVEPTADFSSQTLIGVLINSAASGCENVTVSTITQDSDRLTVNAIVSSAQNPSGPRTCTAVFHNGAYAFVTIAKTTKPVALVTSGGDVNFDVVAKGTYDGTPKKLQLVIQSTTELADALSGVELSDDQTAIADFSTQTMIGVFTAHASACEQTIVTKITDDGAGLTVSANHVSHANINCIAIIVGGSDTFVTIPKTKKPVTFVVTDIVVTH